MTAQPSLIPKASPSSLRVPGGARISAVALSMRHPNGTVALDNVHLTIEPGRLTVIIGPSGAGKTTLLQALAGITADHSGEVTVDGSSGNDTDSGLGYVPQDDALHGELPLRRTLRYAAALRIAAAGTVIDAAVTDAMVSLGIATAADVPVHALSGGQRKRANIAAEILTRPGVCFLDEPTSGLDPAAAADLVAALDRMCREGKTVVFTTHSVQDIEQAQQIIVLAPGGRLVATGSPGQVLRRLGVPTFAALFDLLAGSDVPVALPQSVMPARTRGAAAQLRRRHRSDRPRVVRQWWTLTRRAADILTRNRLTVAILLGSPAAVIAMFAVLFRPDGFGPGAADPTAAVQVAYWLSFAGFFFGLTFGLLQVCTEVTVLRRERHAGVAPGAYVASKVALLTPILLLVNVVMLLVLERLDRIPHLSAAAFVELNVTMALNALAALCLGLLASAAVTSTAQAALALPMLCFPAVLFSGAMVPLSVMASAGHLISDVMSDRWAFEAIARHLDISSLTGPSSPFLGLGASSFYTYWALLGGFVVTSATGAYLTVRHRGGPRRY